jgi:hypothetical protein
LRRLVANHSGRTIQIVSDRVVTQMCCTRTGHPENPLCGRCIELPQLSRVKHTLSSVERPHGLVYEQARYFSARRAQELLVQKLENGAKTTAHERADKPGPRRPAEGRGRCMPSLGTCALSPVLYKNGQHIAHFNMSCLDKLRVLKTEPNCAAPWRPRPGGLSAS